MKTFKKLSEQYREKGRFHPVKPYNVHSVAAASPRKDSDSANVKLKEAEFKKEWSKTGKEATHRESGEKTYEYQELGHDGKPTGKREYRNAQGKSMGESTETPKPKSDHDKWKEEYKKARAAGSSSSNAKARANGAVYEEVEQIDEISKKTLGSYVSKAASSLSQASASSTHKRTKASADYDDNIRRGMKKKDADAHLNRGYDSAKPDIQKVLNRVQGIKKAASRLSKEEVEQVEEGAFKNIATDREETERLAKQKEQVPFDPDPPKKKSVVAGKYGAGYSTARHLARQAMLKQADKYKSVKESLDESRKAEIVKEIMKKKKAKSDDAFQSEPELSSTLTKV